MLQVLRRVVRLSAGRYSSLFVLALAAAMLAGCGAASSSTTSAAQNTPGIQVSNGLLVVTTRSIQVAFEGYTIASMKNLLTGETHIANPGPGLIDLNLENATGQLLQPGSWTLQSDASTGQQVGTLSISDSQRQVTMTVGLDPNSDDVIVRLGGTSAVPGVRGLLWGLQGFNQSGRFILPAHGGIYFDANAPSPTFSFAYPTHWEAQFAIYQSAAGGVLLYARDPKPYYKQIQGSNLLGALEMDVETFALAPWATATSVPTVEWHLKAFQGGWQGAVDAYSAWSQTAFPGLSQYTRPAWTKNIRNVINVDEPDTSLLDAIAAQLDPSKTLINLLGWRASIFESNYPDYTPAAQTKPFVQYAHQLGFHVMLHTNIDGVSLDNQYFTAMSQFQQRDPGTGDLVYWPFGVWPAGPPPPAYILVYAFLSPAASAWRSLYLQSIDNAIQTVQPDALHLDAGGIMLNDGNGLIEGMTTIEGMRQFHRDILTLYPQLALGYESMTETIASFQSFAQRWPAEFPGHPVVIYMLRNQPMSYGFLAQPNPDEAGFINYIRHYEPQGVMPAITIGNADDLSPNHPITSKIVQMMKLWQQNDFQPDWSGDWTGLLFRYKSPDGSATATIQQGANTIVLNAAGQTVYQRALDTNSIATPLFIANWPAYDTNTIFGLDPTEQYWLRSDITRPAASMHLAGLPSRVELGQGTIDAGNYGYFELSTIPEPTFNFFASFGTAKIGIASGNDLDYPLQDGAVVQVTQTLINGSLKSPVIVMAPPLGPMLGGATFVEYQLPVPATPSVLNVSAGISDFGTASSGVIFKAEINGTEVWRQQVTLGQWIPAQVNLAPWAGTTVKLRFLVLGAPNLNPVDAFATLGDLGITVAPSSTPVSFDVVTNGAAAPTAINQPSIQLPQPAIPTPLLLNPTSTTTYKGTIPIPSQSGVAQFAIFASPPSPISLGQSLLTLPFNNWEKGYGGFASPSQSSGIGLVGPVTSGGIVVNPAISVEPAKDNSYALVSWSVQVPLNASTLSFSAGLADLPPSPIQYTGVKFSIFINGQDVWDLSLSASGWNAGSVSLTPWRGQPVVITLQVDSQGSAINDLSNFAGLTMQ